MLETIDAPIPSHQLPGGNPTNRDLYAALLAVQGDIKRVEVKVDKALEFRTQFFAVLSVAKWLGPGGLAAVLFGIFLLLPK